MGGYGSDEAYNDLRNDEVKVLKKEIAELKIAVKKYVGENYEWQKRVQTLKCSNFGLYEHNAGLETNIKTLKAELKAVHATNDILLDKLEKNNG